MSGTMPRVTVAIPCGNGERYIGECLQSVLNQTHPALDILVVDQQSTDRTLEIARSFNDPRITVRRNAIRLTIGANWNQGLRYGTGPYVIIHHQDDLMSPDAVEKKVAFLNTHLSAGFVFSRVGIIDAEGRALPNQHEWFSNDLFNEDHLFESLPFFMALLLGKNLICCPSVMFRREAALSLGGFDEQMEFILDWDMWLRMAAAYPVGYVNAATMYYRIHGKMDSLRHVDRLHEYHFRARSGAVKKSEPLLNRWAATDVLQEMISLLRQVEERVQDPAGLGSIVSPLHGTTESAQEHARIRELVGGIRHPKDHVRALYREIIRLDAVLEEANKRIREFEGSTSFRLGQALLTPLRWLKRMREG